MDISEKHQKLLEAQSQMQPTMTMRQMGQILGSDSSGYVSWLLDRFVSLGLAEKVQRGSKNVYRILPKSYKHNPEAHE